MEGIDLSLNDEHVLRLERLLKYGNEVKFWLRGQKDAIFTVSNADRLANLDVIKYYKQLDLISI